MTQSNELTPPPPAFKVGDEVHYFNGNDFYLGTRTIIAIAPEREPWEDWMQQRYFIAPCDTPWFAHTEDSFVSLADMPVAPRIGYQRKSGA